MSAFIVTDPMWQGILEACGGEETKRDWSEQEKETILNVPELKAHLLEWFQLLELMAECWTDNNLAFLEPLEKTFQPVS